MCVAYDLDEGGTELKWYQGEVIFVSSGSNIVKPGASSACFKAVEASIMRWDANVSCGEERSASAQRLLQ